MHGPLNVKNVLLVLCIKIYVYFNSLKDLLLKVSCTMTVNSRDDDL
jgi:hypothetical protein